MGKAKGKRDDKRIKFTFDSVGICGVLLLVGTLLVIISYIEFKEPLGFWVAWGKSTTNALGTTVVASAVVSFVLELSNLKTFFSGTLGNILGDDFPLESYSTSNLENFHKRLIAHLCEEDIKPDQLGQGLYSYEEEIRKNITSVYYEYHSSKYFITPDEKNGWFEVRAEISYKVVNKYKRANPMRFKVKTYCLNTANGKEDYDNNFKLSEFKVNGEEQNQSCVHIEDIEESANKNYYDYKIRIEKDFGVQRETNIKLKFEYKMPMFDIMQSYKASYPCKNLEHEFRIYPDKQTKEEWSLQCSAFAAFYNKQGGVNGDFNVKQDVDDFLQIKFNKWVFPGSGYVVFFKKEEKKCLQAENVVYNKYTTS